MKLNISALGRGGEISSEADVAHRLDEALGPAARRLAETLLLPSDVGAQKSPC